jgi:glycosyl transferase family 25
MSTLCWSAAYFSKKIEKCYMPNYNFFELNDRNNSYFKTPIYNTILYDVKTTKLNKIKANIITLKEFPQRLDNLTDFIMSLNKIGIKTDIFYGVNGNNLDITHIDENTRQIVYENKIYYNKLNKNNIEEMDIKYTKYYDIFKTIVDRKPLSKGELGCSISHLLLYEQLLNDSDYDHYLILEDDVELCLSLCDVYKHLINIPENYDLIHLSYADCYPFIQTNKINEYYYDIVKRYFNRTTGYLISKSGAIKLLSYSNNIINIPADDLICHSFLNIEDFKVYVPQTYLFKEQGVESVSGQIN